MFFAIMLSRVPLPSIIMPFVAVTVTSDFVVVPAVSRPSVIWLSALTVMAPLTVVRFPIMATAPLPTLVLPASIEIVPPADVTLMISLVSRKTILPVVVFSVREPETVAVSGVPFTAAMSVGSALGEATRSRMVMEGAVNVPPLLIADAVNPSA